jgi:hypothetical protein
MRMRAVSTLMSDDLERSIVNIAMLTGATSTGLNSPPTSPRANVSHAHPAPRTIAIRR